MDKSLEELIEGRIKEASCKNYVEKALRIAHYRGYIVVDELGITHKGSYSYCNGLFEIESIQMPPYNTDKIDRFTRIKYRGAIVFGRILEVYSYVPGEWEEEFEQLYKKAEKLKKTRKNNNFKLRDRNKIKADWGL